MLFIATDSSRFQTHPHRDNLLPLHFKLLRQELLAIQKLQDNLTFELLHIVKHLRPHSAATSGRLNDAGCMLLIAPAHFSCRHLPLH